MYSGFCEKLSCTSVISCAQRVHPLHGPILFSHMRHTPYVALKSPDMNHHEKLWFWKLDQCVIVGWALGMLSYPENLTGSKVYILWSIHWTKYTYITSTLVNRTLHFVICRNIPTSEKVELYESWLVKQEAWIGIIKQKKKKSTKKHGKVNFPPGTPVCRNSFSCRPHAQ